MKPVLLQAAILEVLSEHDSPVPERLIMLALSVEFRVKVTYTDLRTAVTKLEESKYILSVRSHDETVLWGLSDLGRARLIENK